MNLSEEASKLELIWLESGKLEDVDDKFIQESIDKHKTGEPIQVEPQYASGNYKNYCNYSYGLAEFEFEANFFLHNLKKLEQLMNFLQQKDIIVKKYQSNCNFYDSVNSVTVNMIFSVPGYKMNGYVSYNKLFEEIQNHIGVYGQIHNINFRKHQSLMNLYR